MNYTVIFIVELKVNTIPLKRKISVSTGEQLVVLPSLASRVKRLQLLMKVMAVVGLVMMKMMAMVGLMMMVGLVMMKIKVIILMMMVGVDAFFKRLYAF